MHMWEVLNSGSQKAAMARLAGFAGSPLPKRWNKEKTAKGLQEAFLRMGTRFASCFCAEELDLLDLLLEKGEINDFQMMDEIAENSSWFSDEIGQLLTHLSTLKQFGMTCKENRLTRLTDEGRQIVQQSGWRDPSAERHYADVTQCLIGIMQTYGAIPFGRFVEIAAGCYPEDDPQQLEWLIRSRRELDERIQWAGFSDAPDEEWAAMKAQDCEPDELIDVLMVRSDLSYRLYSCREYLHAFRKGTPFLPENHDRMVKICVQYLNMNTETAEEMLGKVRRNRQESVEMLPDHMLLPLIEEISTEDLTQDIVSELMVYLNDVPLWTLRGHTPTELVQNCSRKGGNVVPFPIRH